MNRMTGGARGVLLALCCGCTSAVFKAEAEAEYDVVVYGGTSAGVVAAVQARRMGCSVVVVEPTRRIG